MAQGDRPNTVHPITNAPSQQGARLTKAGGMVQLPLDVLLHVITFASRPTLAALSAVDRLLGSAASKRLYACVILGGSPHAYTSFFVAHGSRASDGPCRHTTELHLNDLGPTRGWPDLPHISTTLFPALERVELDSAPKTLTAGLPILITLNPRQLVIRSPPGNELGYAFLPHLALKDYVRLEELVIQQSDVHPPQGASTLCAVVLPFAPG